MSVNLIVLFSCDRRENEPGSGLGCIAMNIVGSFTWACGPFFLVQGCSLGLWELVEASLMLLTFFCPSGFITAPRGIDLFLPCKL